MRAIGNWIADIFCAIFRIQRAARIGVPRAFSSDPMESNYMVPFRNNQFAAGVTMGMPLSADTFQQQQTQKKFVKPIEVLDELKENPTNFSLNGIDEKIAILRDKEDLITQKYSRYEVSALIECLQNRKKYDKNRSFFARFDTTTEEKVEALTDKYNLQMGDADLFVPEFPDEAIKVMKDYTKRVEKLMNGKKPRFYVIATPKDFQKKVERRDPILLAQSPFGFYYYILGAWDKEMLLLSEL